MHHLSLVHNTPWRHERSVSVERKPSSQYDAGASVTYGE